jgi:hypothetical protein
VIEPKSETYPMFLTYLNGKLSNAVFYSNEEGNKDRFIDNEVHQANFLIDSTNAEVNLYGIRIYSRAFNNQEILNNYTASFATLEEKEKHYKDNKVFNNNNNIDYNIVSSEEYFSRLKIPYMKLTGGYQTVGKEDKWRLKSPLTSAGLPNNKSDYRLVDVEVIYPDTKYFENYYVNNNGKYIFKNQFENGVTMAEASG